MINRASYRKTLRRTKRSLRKRIPVYLKDPNEENVHDLRTAIRRLTIVLQLLPKKVRDDKKVRKYLARYRKLFKANATTRDLDIMISKMSFRSSKQASKTLTKKIRETRESSLKDGMSLAKRLKDSTLPSVNLKATSNSSLETRFRKLSRKYLSEIEEILPQVIESPDDKRKLHLLREQVRSLRYLYGLGKGEALVRQRSILEVWQDILGEIHDSDIFIEYFQKWELSPGIPSFLSSEKVIRKKNYEKFRSTVESGEKLDLTSLADS